MIFLLLRRAGFPFFKEIWNEIYTWIKELFGHPLRDGAIIFGGLIRFNRMPVAALANMLASLAMRTSSRSRRRSTSPFQFDPIECVQENAGVMAPVARIDRSSALRALVESLTLPLVAARRAGKECPALPACR